MAQPIKINFKNCINSNNIINFLILYNCDATTGTFYTIDNDHFKNFKKINPDLVKNMMLLLKQNHAFLKFFNCLNFELKIHNEFKPPLILDLYACLLYGDQKQKDESLLLVLFISFVLLIPAMLFVSCFNLLFSCLLPFVSVLLAFISGIIGSCLSDGNYEKKKATIITCFFLGFDLLPAILLVVAWVCDLFYIDLPEIC